MSGKLDRRTFLELVGAGAGTLAAARTARSASGGSSQPPNFVVLFADDMGYGDLSCFGHPTIQTPRLDRMAEEGVKMTSFYASAPVCSPSRAALMTGRYPPRCGMAGNTGPGNDKHLPFSEITLAEALKEQDYRTACIGKWHLGQKKDEYLPVNRGFDYWFGLPYSNDMRKPWVQTDVPLKLYRGTEPVEHPVNQDTLTERYTEEAVKFIQRAAGDPFFLYMPYNMPHLPLHTSERFRGRSGAGLYGDVIQTLDWSAGQILDTLKQEGVDRDTIVIFTSDNGPWLNLPDRMLQAGNQRWHAGSPGPLRGAKGMTWEGGMRVPMIARWPGHLPAGRVSHELASTLDIFPTFLRAAGMAPPSDRTIDGNDILPLLRGETDSPTDHFFYFRGTDLQAVRGHTWKLRQPDEDDKPRLFHLNRDPAEQYNVADDHPDMVSRLQERMKDLEADIFEG